jgi:cyclopropane fatty-acyl-phospholipid synthase-like methyltransferase
MKKLVKKGYDKIAVTYMRARYQYINTRYLERLNSLLMPNSLLLDLGCGSGKPVDIFFTDKGHRVIGIDISEKQIELAKKNVPQTEYKVKDISKLRDGEYYVDAVVSLYTIIHLPRETHSELFQKINSFLPQDGLILVTMGFSEWEGIDDFYGVNMYFSHYGHETNRDIIEKTGFEIILDEIDDTLKEYHQFILARKTE